MENLPLEFWINTGILILTVAAIIMGPIIAVRITRGSDKRKSETDRKYQILSDLMRTRRARLDPLHVSALNLVELEFYGQSSVCVAYREYVKHLNSTWPAGGESLDRHSQNGDDLFSELLYEIANNLGFKFDKRDLSRLGYMPVGLGEHYDNINANARHLREILEGKRPLNIANFVESKDIFPPSPKKKLIEDQSNGTE